MSQTTINIGPARADKRKGDDRRTNADRRTTMMIWPGTERRHAAERRSWVGRRQAATWRRP